jgi:hypothetical protein
MSDGMGVSDLAMIEGDETDFENDRLLTVLREAGISPNLLTPMQLARLREDMIMDPTPFDEPGAFLAMLRGMGGFEDALNPEEEVAAGHVAPPDLPEMLGVAFCGEVGDLDYQHLHGECTDGFEPEHTQHKPLTAKFMEAMRKKKPL